MMPCMALSFLVCGCASVFRFFVFKQKTAYEVRISDWSSDVCSSDLLDGVRFRTVNVIGAVLLGCTTNAGNGNVTGAIDTYNGAENINVLGCTIRYFTYAGIKIQNSSNINVIGNIVTEGAKPTAANTNASYGI